MHFGKLALAFAILVIGLIGTNVQAQQDDYYLRKVLPKISALEVKVEKFDNTDAYQLRRLNTDVRLAKEMFARAESKSPSYAKTKERLDAILKKMEVLNKPKAAPKLSVDKAAMEKKYGGRYGGANAKMPKFLYGDLKADRKDEILKYAKQVQQLNHDLSKELPAMKENKDVFKYQIRYAEYLAGDIKKQHKSLIERLTRPATNANQRLKIAAEVDLSNKNHVINRLGERSRNQIDKMVEEAEPMLELALEIESLMKSNLGASALQTEFNKLQELYKAKVALVAGGKLTELPKSLDKPELAKIAKEVLANKKYKISGIKKMVVNADKRRKERTTFEVSGDAIEKVVRVWDEFQVCTVEEIDGKLYLHYNTIAYFHRGATTTPTKMWIISNRFKSAEISKENAGLK